MQSMRQALTYFKEAWQELEKVSWPDRRTSIRLTAAVLVMAGIMGGFIAVADLGLTEALQQFILGM